MTSQDDLTGYELRVEPATSRLNAFAEQLVSELDEQNGGFRWWSGYSDWKTLTLIADYLVQSVLGASYALGSASLAAMVHRESTSAENDAVMATWLPLAQSGETDPNAFLAAIPRDADSRRRDLTIRQSAEQCFFHLGQTLDRLAAALIIVGGFNQRDVVVADWGTVDMGTPSRPGLLAEVAGTVSPRRIEPPGTPGLQLQTDLLAPIAAADGYGVAEWLQWTRDTRNAMTHRSPATQLNVMLGNMNDGIRFVRLFYRQPRWSELQSLVFGAQGSLFDAFVQRASEDVLDGLCEAMTRLVAALSDAMTICWAARRATPTMIVQPGGQWRNVIPTEAASGFQGFGENLSKRLAEIPFDAMFVNDRGGKRWTAGRVMDARRGEWNT